MKKKIVYLLLILIMPLMLFSGCGNNAQTSSNGSEFIIGDIVFIKVIRGDDFDIFVDKNTKVMYIFNKTTYQGGLTVLVNADGTPMLWEGELKGENK